MTTKLSLSNSLLYGVNKQLLTKLQRAQNAAARMLTRTRKCDHISRILKQLHWLPIRQRIQFKLLLHTWKSLHAMAPMNIHELLSPYILKRS